MFKSAREAAAAAERRAAQVGLDRHQARRNMLLLLPKFPMLDSPSSAYYARLCPIVPIILRKCQEFPALCRNY